MDYAYIFDAVYSPRARGKKDGSLYEMKPVSLLSQVLEGLRQRCELPCEAVEDLVLGCVSALGDQGMNIAKGALLHAGWPHSVSGLTLNRFCASGLEALNVAAAKVSAGADSFLIAGGLESMSRVPMGSDGGPWAQDPETNRRAGFIPQGISADLIASLEGFRREDLDLFALDSHRKAQKAADDGYWRSMLPIRDACGLPILASNELVRADASLAALSQLKASFAAISNMGFHAVVAQKFPLLESMEHGHTAGNSSAIADGAALLLLGKKELEKNLGKKPRARILSHAVIGSDPTLMLAGPYQATRKALDKAGLSFSDVDLFEVNEAFASVVLKFQKDSGVPMEKINVNGGAIALGHPLGATGAILAATLLDELDRRRQRYGVVSLCIGAGMGIATVFERVQ